MEQIMTAAQKFFAVAQADVTVLGVGSTKEAAVEDWSGWSDEPVETVESLAGFPKSNGEVYLAECSEELYRNVMAGDVTHFDFDPTSRMIVVA